VRYEPRYVDVNALMDRSVVIGGHRYVPWEKIAEVQTAQTTALGHWEKLRPMYYRCSVCGFSRRGDRTRYCPKCGAKMYGGGAP